jgi:hypothetical protein
VLPQPRDGPLDQGDAPFRLAVPGHRPAEPGLGDPGRDLVAAAAVQLDRPGERLLGHRVVPVPQDGDPAGGVERPGPLGVGERRVGEPLGERHPERHREIVVVEHVVGMIGPVQQLVGGDVRRQPREGRRVRRAAAHLGRAPPGRRLLRPRGPLIGHPGAGPGHGGQRQIVDDRRRGQPPGQVGAAVAGPVADVEPGREVAGRLGQLVGERRDGHRTGVAAGCRPAVHGEPSPAAAGEPAQYHGRGRGELHGGPRRRGPVQPVQVPLDDLQSPGLVAGQPTELDVLGDLEQIGQPVAEPPVAAQVGLVARSSWLVRR